MRHDPRLQRLGRRRRQRDSIALHDKVEVDLRSAQQQVAHASADQVELHVALLGEGDDRSQRVACRLGEPSL